jgi:AAA domain
MQQNRIIGAIGPKGSGKTYTVSEYLAQQERYVVFDIMGDSAYLKSAEDVIDSRKELLDAVKEPTFKIVYRAKIERDEKTGDITAPDLGFVVDVAHTTGNMLLVIDEAHLLCDTHNIPAALFAACTVGRHRQLSLLYVSHRFALVDRIVTTNTDEFWFWRIIEPADLDGIRQRCGPDTMERVRHASKLERKGDEIIPGEMVRWTIEDGATNEHDKDIDDESETDFDERIGG